MKVKLSFLLIIGVILTVTPAYAWWDANWQYRKSFTIHSYVTRDDYQVNITIDTESLISAGKMNSDCSDLRIVAGDDVTKLPYYIESGCNTPNTKVWFKADLTAGDNTFYLYYGNSLATSESSITDVYDLYDDFDSIDSNIWTIRKTSTGKVEIQDGALYEYAGTDSTSYAGIYSAGNKEFGIGYCIEYKFYVYSTSEAGKNTYAHDVGFLHDGTLMSAYFPYDNTYWVMERRDTSESKILKRLDGSTDTLASGDVCSLDTWHTGMIKYTDSSIKYYVDGSLKLSYDVSSYDRSSGGLIITTEGGTSIQGQWKVDDLKVRKCSDQEPYLQSWGLEEQPTSYQINIFLQDEWHDNAVYEIKTRYKPVDKIADRIDYNLSVGNITVNITDIEAKNYSICNGLVNVTTEITDWPEDYKDFKHMLTLEVESPKNFSNVVIAVSPGSIETNENCSDIVILPDEKPHWVDYCGYDNVTIFFRTDLQAGSNEFKILYGKDTHYQDLTSETFIKFDNFTVFNSSYWYGKRATCSDGTDGSYSVTNGHLRLYSGSCGTSFASVFSTINGYRYDYDDKEIFLRFKDIHSSESYCFDVGFMHNGTVIDGQYFPYDDVYWFQICPVIDQIKILRRVDGSTTTLASDSFTEDLGDEWHNLTIFYNSSIILVKLDNKPLINASISGYDWTDGGVCINAEGGSTYQSDYYVDDFRIYKAPYDFSSSLHKISGVFWINTTVFTGHTKETVKVNVSTEVTVGTEKISAKADKALTPKSIATFNITAENDKFIEGVQSWLKASGKFFYRAFASGMQDKIYLICKNKEERKVVAHEIENFTDTLSFYIPTIPNSTSINYLSDSFKCWLYYPSLEISEITYTNYEGNENSSYSYSPVNISNYSSKSYTYYLMKLCKCGTTNCTSTKTVEITKFYNEIDKSDVTSKITDVKFFSEIWYGNNDSFTRIWGVDDKSICIYPSWASYGTKTTITYSSSSYPARNYFLWDCDVLLTNQTHQLELYSLYQDNATVVTIYVKDQAGNPVEDAIVKFMKYYADENAYITVAEAKTNFEGKASTTLNLYSTWYKIVIIKDCEVVAEYSPTQITSTSLEFTLQEEAEYIYGLTEGLSYNCTIMRNESYIKCTVVDSTGKMNYAELIVQKGLFAKNQTICDVKVYSSGETLLCTNLDLNYSYYYTLAVNMSGSVITLTTGYIEGIKEVFIGEIEEKKYLLLASFIIITMMTCIGLWNPAVAIVMATAGLGICWAVGFVELMPSTLISIVCVAAIAIWRVRS